jgi:predicted DNA-binding protein (UPF0251 family)
MKKPRRTAEQQRLEVAERRALRLIRTGGLTLRKGAWRFGIARVGNAPVDRLIATGKAMVSGDRCIPASPQAVQP